MCHIAPCYFNMKELYHYTSFKTLFRIIKPNGVEWLARYYKYFDQKDYDWIRDEAKPIIEEMCVANNWKFDPDFEMYRPYLISFCRSEKSDYMWKEFGENHEGIIIAINEDVLRKEATLLSNIPALLVPCEYINTKWNKTMLIGSINKIAKAIDLCPNDDRLLFASVGLMQGCFNEEQEIRYVTIEQKLASYVLDENEIVKKIPYEPKVYEKYIPFPKELVSRIILGRENSSQDYEDVKYYIKNCGYSPDIVSLQY